MMAKTISFLALVWSAQCVCAITVCNNFWSYSWSSFSSDCYDDLVYEQNISEIIRSWGLTAEEHYLTTEDGYKILVERAYGNITKPRPVILVHGIMLNSLIFVAQREKSLTHLLAKLGYDVWLLNYRGTKYSRGHESLSTDNRDYWKFNVDDLGIHDVRTTIKHVNKIGKQAPFYIGYSMGATGFFVYSTSFPEEARQLVKGMVALAPVINWKDTKTPMRFLYPAWPKLKSSIVYEVYHGEVYSGMQRTVPMFLTTTPGLYMLQYLYGVFFGDSFTHMDPIALPTSTIALDSTGAEVATQFFQIYASGVFQKYDYGKQKNLEMYGSEQPPAYNMSKVPVPVAIFSGGSDAVASITNCDQIYAEIQPSVRCGYRKLPTWGHSDFLNAKDIVESLYLDVIDKLEDIELGNCNN